MYVCVYVRGQGLGIFAECNSILMSGQGQLTEETRRKDDIRRLESVDSAR